MPLAPLNQIARIALLAALTAPACAQTPDQLADDPIPAALFDPAAEARLPSFQRFARLGYAVTRDGEVGASKPSAQTLTGKASVTFETPKSFYGSVIEEVFFAFPDSSAVYVGPIENAPDIASDSDAALEDVPSGIDFFTDYWWTYAVVVVDSDGSGFDYSGLSNIELDEIVGTFIDYGDLYEFDVYFDDVQATHELRLNSFELMKQHVLHADAGVNSWRSGWRFDAFIDDWRIGFGDELVATTPVDASHASFDFLTDLRTSSYVTSGLRLNNHRDRFAWSGSGSILGQTGAEVENDHFLIGPQLGVGAVAESGFWRFEAALLGAAGYQRTETDLYGVFGQGAVPGGLNNAVSVQSTESTARASEDDFAWHVETRLAAGCQLSQRWRLDAAWRWFVTGPHYDADASMAYTAPTFSLRPTEGSRIDRNDLFLGLTYTR